MSAVFDQIVKQVNLLEAEELRRLNHIIIERLHPQDNQQRRRKFYQALIEAGLVKEIKEQRFSPSRKRTLVEVTGEPVSETIIKERR